MTAGSAAPGTLGMTVGSRWRGKKKKGQHPTVLFGLRERLKHTLSYRGIDPEDSDLIREETLDLV